MIRQKRGFFNPIMLAAILIIALLVVFSPKILEKLSVIGIEDDYLMYDDFSRGYVDDSLWDYEGTAPEVDSMGAYLPGYQAAGMTLIPEKEMLGKGFKTKLLASTPYCNCAGCTCRKDGYSTVSLIMNGITIYTCGDKYNYGKTTSCFIEGIPSFENPEVYTIRLNGEDHKSMNLSNPDGDKKVKIALNIRAYDSYGVRDGKGNPLDLKPRVEFLKYKVPYNCKIEDDEILMFDSFLAGSSVNISTLSYEPVKFCLDYPIKARSFTQDGIKTDIRGEILQKMVRGKSATVPENEEWKVYYITKLTPDIDLRCDIDKAYSTETGTCENPGEQTIVGCKTASDCYVPSGCIGLTAQCVGNSCSYEGDCVFPPSQKTSSLWEKIMSLAFFQWIQSLWS